jgi:hypothetical protein
MAGAANTSRIAFAPTATIGVGNTNRTAAALTAENGVASTDRIACARNAARGDRVPAGTRLLVTSMVTRDAARWELPTSI